MARYVHKRGNLYPDRVLAEALGVGVEAMGAILALFVDVRGVRLLHRPGVVAMVVLSRGG